MEVQQTAQVLRPMLGPMLGPVLGPVLGPMLRPMLGLRSASILWVLLNDY